ncbi:MAG TPA: 5-oxoprolinase subunit PxpA [Pyrinomonadaceae bacterium]|nr:5-oxoprolinase subunit PxpA [Pyrinomonadaceae bacterium]
MKVIDLNCDMGEGMPNDAELMNYVSSVNIACGYHAGNAATMKRTAELALEKGLAIGAHPGYADLANFGRTSMTLPPAEVDRIVTEQVEALQEICHSLGTNLHHVKPHGALYNQAAKDRQLSRTIARAIKKVDPDLVCYGLAGSLMIDEATHVGLVTASEVFADRTYQNDGTLTPRSWPNALIETTPSSIAQVLQMVLENTVTSTEGIAIPLTPETICIHGDGAHAVEFARAVKQALETHEVTIKPI